MALLLGIDTGGTFTDAVIYDEEKRHVIAKAKALTTRDDLSIGIGGSIARVMEESATPATDISLVSISTTLATNALVEGVRRRICLIFVGFDEADLKRSGLSEALGNDPVIAIPGGFRATGEPRAPLDLDALAVQVDAIKDSVEAFAVTAIFGGRNPAHEIAIREMIRARCPHPVTCGHDLSGELDGPRNALTCVLNVRLIGTIAALIASTETVLKHHQIAAPLMVVRGDGSLVSAAFARERPIETILSGPAASLVGAAHLTGLQDAVISDIGGTTTDIAVLRDGRPLLSASGATVGGHRTMIEAVAMTTHGLGGDSEISLDDRAFRPALTLGPRKLVPISLLALDHPALVADSLASQLRAPRASETDARFIIPTAEASAPQDGLRNIDRSVLAKLGTKPSPLDRLGLTRLETGALSLLVSLGLVRIAGFTPSDAAHVLGLHDAWDRDAAIAAATVFARKKDRKGTPIAPNPESLSRMVIDTLTRHSAEAVLGAALVHDGMDTNLVSSPLVAAALEGGRSATRIDIGVSLPVIGLGASAPTYYPAITKALGAECVVPDHADVANAVGAVTGRITIERTILLTSPSEGIYRVHLPDASTDFASLDDAKNAARTHLDGQTRADAAAAGAPAADLTFEYTETAPVVENRKMFIEGVLTARASGRPAIESAADRAI